MKRETLRNKVLTRITIRAYLTRMNTLQKETSINVRVPKKLRRHLERLAKDDSRSLSSFVRLKLEGIARNPEVRA